MTDYQLEEHDDDKPIGRILSRRDVLALLGGGGVALLTGCSISQFLGNAPESTVIPTGTGSSTILPSCVVRPALTEGPYFVEVGLNRSDIRTDPSTGTVKEGALLRIKFNVSDVSADSCNPIEGAQVDVWHCDALGVYSGVSDPGFDTSSQEWLRGYQLTDAMGYAEFTTIYPGWYSGRAVHIHFKIRTEPAAEQGYEFTSQFFFDENLTDIVHALLPYASKGYRDTLNSNDGIFQGSGGLLTLNVVEVADSYEATFDIGLDLSQPAPEASGGGRRPPAGRP
jgi:protocatechuate 3,4-dioxygenase beta subunit